MSIRIVVCIDLPCDTAVEAYKRLYQIMSDIPSEENQKTGPLIEGWESTDEWFDEEGIPLTALEVEAARKSVLDELECSGHD